MKRLLAAIAPLLFAACSGSGTVHVDLNSDESQLTNALTDSRSDALSGSSDLSAVKSIKVTITEIRVHLADVDHSDDVKEDEAKDDDGGWHTVSTVPQTFDLLTIKADAVRPLGDIELPEGKITQIRLKLKTDGDNGSGAERIVGAVTELDDTKCDLIAPKSVVNPGLKISGVFKAAKVDKGGKHTVVVNLQLKGDPRETLNGVCAYRIKPVIKFKKTGSGSGKK